MLLLLADYRHGTSHGVGHFLNVHEGPQSLSTRISSNEAKLVAGNVLSNEPGELSLLLVGGWSKMALMLFERPARVLFGGQIWD